MKQDKQLEKQYQVVAENNSKGDICAEFFTELDKLFRVLPALNHEGQNRQISEFQAKFGVQERFQEWLIEENEMMDRRQDTYKEVYSEINGDEFNGRRSENPDSLVARVRDIVLVVEDHINDPEDNPLTNAHLEQLEAIQKQLDDVSTMIYGEL